MGQGAESCGGYDVEYDEYEELIADGMWTQKNGDAIHVTEMDSRHIKNTIRLCKGLSLSSDFSCDSEKWDDWVEIFENELSGRDAHKPTSVGPLRVANDVRGKTVERTCKCNSKFMARQADINRGWAKSCSKSCAARFK